MSGIPSVHQVLHGRRRAPVVQTLAPPVRVQTPGSIVYPAAPTTGAPEPLAPVSADERSANPLRPATLDEMVGQDQLKPLLRRLIDSARASGRPLDHILLVGGAGTGKSTLANVLANEIGRPTYQLRAPLSLDIFERLRASMNDGDVLYVDELHQQVSGDRRGVTQACDPETFFHVMEDRRLALPSGIVNFPDVTIIGATTDAGLLPQPFLDRFPLRPRLLPYTVEEMAALALANAAALDLDLNRDAAELLAGACRGVPRVLNSYVRNCASLAQGTITVAVAREVVTVLNSTTLDGLDLDMQRLLILLLDRGWRVVRGEVRYIAGMNTIATALGKSRDQKAVALYVEPYLIERGYLAVGHGGRELTPSGVERARELTQGANR